MSQYAPSYEYAASDVDLQVDSRAPILESGRSRLTVLAFIPPLALASASWMGGGVANFTDFAFLMMTAICIVLIIRELYMFSERWGLGALVLYGGTLVWFCQDYLSNWFLKPNRAVIYNLSNQNVAKGAFFTILYVASMSVGLNLGRGRRLVRWMQKTPDIHTSKAGFILMVLIFMFGVSPYFIFTGEPWYMAMWHQLEGGRAFGGVWTVGRSGSVNYNWGAYVAQILQAGEIGSIFAVLYVILIARNVLAKAIGWLIWIFWLLMGTGTGTRGEVVQSCLPVVFAYFFKYNAIATARARRISIRGYIVSGLLLIGILVLVQFQITFRDVGLIQGSFSNISSDIAGNSMFSEGLLAYKLIPDRRDYFYDALGIEGAIRPPLDTIAWCFIAPMPRALWRTKPIDPVWVWYNEVVTGNANGTEGTTIATGGSAGWYIRYGPMGVIEGGMIVGWLMYVGECLFRRCSGRLNLLVLALGWQTWLFRAFRGFGWVDFTELLVGFATLAVLTVFVNIFAGGRGEPETS